MTNAKSGKAQMRKSAEIEHKMHLMTILVHNVSADIDTLLAKEAVEGEKSEIIYQLYKVKAFALDEMDYLAEQKQARSDGINHPMY